MGEKKKILSVAKTDFLRRTRQIALRRAGYAVASVKDFNEIEALSRENVFDVAVVGHAFDPQAKRVIAEIIRRYFPDVPIVELTIVVYFGVPNKYSTIVVPSSDNVSIDELWKLMLLMFPP